MSKYSAKAAVSSHCWDVNVHISLAPRRSLSPPPLSEQVGMRRMYTSVSHLPLMGIYPPYQHNLHNTTTSYSSAAKVLWWHVLLCTCMYRVLYREVLRIMYYAVFLNFSESPLWWCYPSIHLISQYPIKQLKDEASGVDTAEKLGNFDSTVSSLKGTCTCIVYMKGWVEKGDKSLFVKKWV